MFTDNKYTFLHEGKLFESSKPSLFTVKTIFKTLNIISTGVVGL